MFDALELGGKHVGVFACALTDGMLALSDGFLGFAWGVVGCIKVGVGLWEIVEAWVGGEVRFAWGKVVGFLEVVEVWVGDEVEFAWGCAGNKKVGNGFFMVEEVWASGVVEVVEVVGFSGR